ncbi:putative transcription factor HRT family [Arabidopsis thaliana]
MLVVLQIHSSINVKVFATCLSSSRCPLYPSHWNLCRWNNKQGGTEIDKLSSPIRKRNENKRKEIGFGDGVSFAVVFTMFKRDDYIRTNHDPFFSKWQGFARSMFLRKPISETAELRKTFADYSLISRDLGPKILVGANDKENFREGKDRVGRNRVQGAFQGLYELSHDHGRKDDVLVANLGQPESIRSRLRSYSRSFAHHDLLKQGFSQTILPTTQNKSDNRTEEKKSDSEEEREVSSDAADKESNSLPSILRLSRSRPQPVSEKHDDIVDESDSASACGVLLEDGTTCTTTPVKGRKRCTEHKGKRLSRVSPGIHIPCEVPTVRECEETENICGVILPDMIRCRSKPVSRRKTMRGSQGNES